MSRNSINRTVMIFLACQSTRTFNKSAMSFSYLRVYLYGRLSVNKTNQSIRWIVICPADSNNSGQVDKCGI